MIQQTQKTKCYKYNVTIMLYKYMLKKDEQECKKRIMIRVYNQV